MVSKKQVDILDRTYKFSLGVIKLAETLSNKPVARIIAGQLLRSGTSIGANVIEAQSGSSTKDFTNYLSIALKSSNESKYWLNLLKDSGNAKKESVDSLITELNQISNILGSSLVTLRNRMLNH
jgi:four helix bundle protein